MHIEELDLTIEPTPQELLALSSTSFLRTLKRSSASDARLPRGSIVNVCDTHKVAVVTEVLDQHCLIHFVTYDKSSAAWMQRGDCDVVRFDQVQRIEVPRPDDVQHGVGCMFQSLGRQTPTFRKYGDESKNERWW